MGLRVSISGLASPLNKRLRVWDRNQTDPGWRRPIPWRFSPAIPLFVDSNLLLYYVDPVDAFKQGRAADWLNHLWMTGAGRLSWQVLHEFYQNSVKKMRLEPEKAREVVEDLAHWRPIDISPGLVRRAWHWTDCAQLPYWDALIIATAERSGARYLLSEDFQANHRYEYIQVIDPFERSPADFPA